MEAFSPTGLKDAAGAGDWCTAGLIDNLARGAFLDFETLPEVNSRRLFVSVKRSRRGTVVLRAPAVECTKSPKETSIETSHSFLRAQHSKLG